MRILTKRENELKEIKQQIKQKSDEIIESLLKNDKKERNFIELELQICTELNKIGAEILERIVPILYGEGYSGPKIEVNEQTLYQCEARSRERGLITAFGKIKIKRAVYTEYHSGGTKSFLDEQLGIENKRHCPLIRYWSDLLGIVTPFEEARDTLNKIRGINISTKQVMLSTEEMGKKAKLKHEDQIKDIILDKKGKVKKAKVNLNLNAKRTVYIETDGCQINTVNGWKECKSFMIFETEKESEDEHRLINKRYYSTMGDSGELKRQLKYEIESYSGKDEIRIVVIGDGAKWIWNASKELFPRDKLTKCPRIIEIVDFFHALEKIGDIKKEIYSNSEKGIRFYEECKKLLKDGNIETLEQTLFKLKIEQKDDEKVSFIDEILKYFMNNKDKMNYAKYKKLGLCIGSGAIESANKFVIQRRVKLQGMRWNEDNLNYMVHLRVDYINGNMDSYYNIHSNPLMNSVASCSVT